VFFIFLLVIVVSAKEGQALFETFSKSYQAEWQS